MPNSIGLRNFFRASLVAQMVKNGFDLWTRKIPGEGNGYPVFLPGEFHGQRSLVGCRELDRELDTTEQLTLSLILSDKGMLK